MALERARQANELVERYRRGFRFGLAHGRLSRFTVPSLGFYNLTHARITWDQPLLSELWMDRAPQARACERPADRRVFLGFIPHMSR
jgi:hypothetical protein